ncbi:MAG: pectinesterase family protein [Patescibacteria group bacterium]|nr:pectinesterase family protein [Patescibacteria group bacterium]
MKQKKHQIFPGMALAIFLLLFAASASGDLYDFYVDSASTQTNEDGTESCPFKTIGAAIRHIESESLEGKNIYTKKGTYNEQVELTNDTNLIGEDRHETIINGEGKDKGIYFHSTESRVQNLTVEKASVNLKVDKKSKVTVENCSIRESGGDGIEVDRSGYSKNYKFTLKDSSVKDSGERGMYIFKRKFEITGSEISGNGGEGIDLHTSARGTIKDNEIKNNEESGIEMIMGGANVSIRGNNISRNDTQGVTIQVYNSRQGKVKLTKNDIVNNSGYGIRYARYDHGKLKMKFQDFIKKCVKRKSNSIGGNSDGDYAYQ